MEENYFSEKTENWHFNYKFLLLKFWSFWYWFIISLFLFFLIAHFINIHKQNIYEMYNYISIRNDKNPFLKANNGLFFNWGEGEKKVNLVKTMLKLHQHNEKVVQQLKSYIKYKKKESYYITNLYHQSPFIFEMDSTKYQLINEPIHIKILDNKHFQISIKPSHKFYTLYHYGKHQTKKIPAEVFQEKMLFNKKIKKPYLTGIIKKRSGEKHTKNDDYIFYLENFNLVTRHFQENLSIKPLNKNSNILILKLKGTNKNEIADYLNTTTQILQNQILQDKNQFAINTIKFIDSTLNIIKTELHLASDNLKNFVNNRTILKMDNPTQQLFSQLNELDNQQSKIQLKKMYYNQLKNYLINRKKYDHIPAPSVAGITDPTLVHKVTQLTRLAMDKKNLLQNFKIDAPTIQHLDLQLNSLKNSLIETIQSALLNLETEHNLLNKKIYLIEKQINELPDDKQVLLALKRQYDMKLETYNHLLKKRNEAKILKASNISDIKIIEKAKDIGQSPIAPNRKTNYFIAIILGLLVPAIVISILYFFENKVYDISEIEKLISLPVIGQIYHWGKKEPYNFKQHPHEVISESFRSIRTSLRFMTPKKKSNITTLITSTMPDEGKTFISTNLAIAQAMSNKKTILLEFDLRKPNFLKTFTQINNKNKGISEYLCGEATIENIIISTDVKNLDVILAGTFPPNPSELILTGQTAQLFKQLKERYEQILIDSPPLGLVNDANELAKYVDQSLIIIRENFTYKSAVKELNLLMENKLKYGIIYNDYKINIFNKYQYSKYNGYEDYFPNKKSKKEQILSRIKKIFTPAA